jgi:vacuolar protein sorting-associated protein 26
MAYFFVSPIDVDINLEGEELRKQVDMKTEKEKTISCPVFYDGDPVTGQVWFSALRRAYYEYDHF